MQLRYTILYVENVVETLNFYEQAFGLKRKMLHECGDYAELATGDTKLAFAAKNTSKIQGEVSSKHNAKNPIFEIAFETENVAHALQAAITAGAILIQDIKEEPWGQTTSYVSDSNGFLIEICSPVKNQS